MARRGHAKMSIATADKTAGGSKSAMNYALGLTRNSCFDSFRYSSSPTFSKIMLLAFFSLSLLSFALFSLSSGMTWPRRNQISFQTICARNKKKETRILSSYSSLFLSLSLFLFTVTKDERITLVAKLQSNEDTLMRD